VTAAVSSIRCLAGLLRFLNAEKIRRTYGAVAEIAGGSTQSVGGRLGARRIEASWVVRSDTGLPRGYSPELMHPELQRTDDIIRTGAELKRRMAARC
jgi:hypothetical protein